MMGGMPRRYRQGIEEGERAKWIVMNRGLDRSLAVSSICSSSSSPLLRSCCSQVSTGACLGYGGDAMGARVGYSGQGKARQGKARQLRGEQLVEIPFGCSDLTCASFFSLLLFLSWSMSPRPKNTREMEIERTSSRVGPGVEIRALIRCDGGK